MWNMFKVSNKNTRTTWMNIFHSEHISHFFLVFLLLALNKWMLAQQNLLFSKKIMGTPNAGKPNQRELLFSKTKECREVQNSTCLSSAFEAIPSYVFQYLFYHFLPKMIFHGFHSIISIGESTIMDCIVLSNKKIFNRNCFKHN